MNIDIIIVALFLITVVYVINQAINSVDKQTKIDFIRKDNAVTPETIDKDPKEEPFDNQLGRFTLGDRKLKDILDVSFKFEDRYKYDIDKPENDKQPRFLGIKVINKAPDAEIYVDWDRCTVTDYENASRRIIRLTTSFPPILLASQPPASQPPTLVAPGGKLDANVTAEDLLKLEDGKQTMVPSGPILDFNKIKKTSENKKVPEAVREQLKKDLTAFEERKKKYQFFLRLTLKLVDIRGSRPPSLDSLPPLEQTAAGSNVVPIRDYPPPNLTSVLPLGQATTSANSTDISRSGAIEQTYYLWCKFTVTNMPWFDQLPWNPKK